MFTKPLTILKLVINSLFFSFRNKEQNLEIRNTSWAPGFSTKKKKSILVCSSELPLHVVIIRFCSLLNFLWFMKSQRHPIFKYPPNTLYVQHLSLLAPQFTLTLTPKIQKLCVNTHPCNKIQSPECLEYFQTYFT